ncbi:MAG TPA: hypothetical protein VHR64_08075 [Thermomicrobiales bacterium]|nr:hypothetical protein [Thermomicrobiales bacterium]
MLQRVHRRLQIVPGDMPVGDDPDFRRVDESLQAVTERSARARLKDDVVAPLAEMDGNPLAGHRCHRHGTGDPL